MVSSRGMKARSLMPSVVLGLFLITLPLFMPTALQGVFTRILIFGMFALSLDIIFGYAGLWSFGHAAFFGVGAYVVGLLVLKTGITSFWLAAPIAILATSLAASIFGLIALRTSGVYFLLITFALGQLVFSIVLKWTGLTGGSDGLAGIPMPDIGFMRLSSPTGMYYFVLAAFVACHLGLSRLIGSPFGLSLKGIGENEIRMRALGYNTWLCNYVAYIIAGLFGGIAGVFFSYFNGLVAPTHVGVAASAMITVMLIIGGSKTLLGPFLGAAVIILLEYFVSIYTPERWPLIVGAVFVAAAMYARGGIMVRLGRIWRQVNR